MIKNKRAYSVGIFYILREYIWYEGMYKEYQTFESYNTIYRIISDYIKCLGRFGSMMVVYRVLYYVENMFKF